MTELHEAVELWVEAQQEFPSPVPAERLLLEPFISLD